MQNYNNLLKKQTKLLQVGEVMQNIMHQWKQPLYVLYTMTSGVLVKNELGMANEAMYKETLENINKNIKHLITTMDYFNDFINIENNKRVFNLTHCLESCITIIEPLLKTNNITIHKCCKNTKIFGVEIELMQVFLNIFNNAIYVLTENETQVEKNIFIETNITNDKIIICIKDDAGGIQLDNPNLIFDQYYSSKKSHIGTGLGLYITKQIIKDKMEGDIFVENVRYSYKNKLRYGAQFTIHLNQTNLKKISGGKNVKQH
jgi:signal transduction histidine kinase